jgi:hypothetical protein
MTQVYVKELGLSEREEKRLRCLVGARYFFNFYSFFINMTWRDGDVACVLHVLHAT